MHCKCSINVVYDNGDYFLKDEMQIWDPMQCSPLALDSSTEGPLERERCFQLGLLQRIQAIGSVKRYKNNLQSI